MAIYWGRMSGYLGRKPILLLSCAAVGISMSLLGMSTTFWMVVVSRCILGGLNSNLGIMKTAVGEMADDTNRADAFALMSVPWAAGMSLGPLIGGSLSDPHTHFPHIFSGKLWKDFPYLLPCAIIVLTSFLAFLVAFVHLRETLPHKHNTANSPESTSMTTRSQLPLPLRTLITSRVLLSISNYFVLSFLTMAYLAIQPLFLAMPLSIGGLALEPMQIGSILGFYGFHNAFVQALLLGPLIRGFGLRRVLRCSLSALIPIFLLFPLMNIHAKDWQIHHHPNSRFIVYTLLAAQFILLSVQDSGYGCVYMYITSSAPNRHSLGRVNGIGQTVVAIARLVGPAFGNTVLGLSIEKGWVGGYAVYFMLSCVAVGGVLLVGMLPKSAWETEEVEGG
ncbi:MFS general substrate transporter [Macrolepiota fuliginosa MF-IS2]|uniref:MFS general substrate transporter n=1 Tax=Macrolepiota fuliginosa MF-IS2 TaxID=1400762 RepID=A0A9P5XMS3_9AGAR|nr:MFS general substrate transporter [Macrolepiota fuliginosa MF-IS2]